MDRVVVARYPNAGFGDHVSGLMGSWYVARCTGRTLVIDWRGSRYNADKSKNCFNDFFQSRDTIGGVPVVASDDLSDIEYQLPIFPEKWSRDSLRATDHVPHTLEETDLLYDLMARGGDRPEPTIVVNQDAWATPPRDELRKFFADLKFAEAIEDAASRFIEQRMDGDPHIGVHICHGNGENIDGRVVYWLDGISLVRQLRRNKRADIFVAREGDVDGGEFADNMPPTLMADPRQTRSENALYANVARRVREIRAAYGKDLPVFLCTDAARVVEGIGQRVGNMVTYPKTMLAEGAGPLHQTRVTSGSASSGSVERTLIDDMLIETEILRRSSSLICIPSQFSIMPRVELDDEDIHLLKPGFVNRVIGRILA